MVGRIRFALERFGSPRHGSHVAQLFSLGHFALMALPFIFQQQSGWFDVTHELDVPNPPWTFSKLDGVGAFQFSIATYKRGAVPSPSASVLLSLLREFAVLHELGEPADIITEESDLRLAAASFQSGGNFMRVWYVSDGYSFAKVTYTCACGVEQAELSDCEQMVRTLRFSNEAVA